MTAKSRIASHRTDAGGKAEAATRPARSKPFHAKRRIHRMLAEHSPDVIVCFDTLHRRTYVNPAYERLSGIPAAELIGRTPLERSVLAPKFAAIVDRVIGRVLDTCRPADVVLAIDAAGKNVHFHLRAIPECNRIGKVVGVFTFSRDISELKYQERLLLLREQEFRALAENSPDHIVRYDQNCRRSYVNPAHQRASGLPIHMLIGRSSIETGDLPVSAAAALERTMLGVMVSGVADDIELDWRRSDGTRVVQHIVIVPERTNDGRISSVLTIARDITELKETERQLQQAEAMAHLGHWQWDVRLQKGKLSAEVCRIFGKPADWSPSKEEVLDAVVAEDREWITTALDVAFAGRKPDTSFDYRIQIDDRLLDIHSAAWVEYDSSGHPVRLVGTAQDVSELKRYQQQLHSLAFYDPITQLPNRELFNDRIRLAIAQAYRHDTEVAVLILDLDNFKAVNDTLGHGAGDQVLRDTATRLRECVREYDSVARLGGDEFGFVLAEMPPEADVGKICRKILDTLGEAYVVEGKELFLTGSIGIARYPKDGKTISDLLQFADAAMYHAKEAGRNNYQFYASSLTAQITERLGLAACMRRAEVNGEFELYFQPQIDLASGRLIGAEALLRWNHPDEGLTLPDKFIGIAEETGLIVGIGEWVLREACVLARLWNAHRRTPLKIAVNLSPRQFKMNDLVATVKHVLDETGCSPAWIELEITESLLLDDITEVTHTLNALHDLGLSISIDDFGTGYSALGYLNRLPVESIKIDRSFVHDVANKRDNAELVKAIIAMAHSLNLTLVAEGIEDHLQEQFLKMHGCQCGQGYLYGRPMPRASFEALIRQPDEEVWPEIPQQEPGVPQIAAVNPT
jgi:diguanylate cyclase (GGDEF)-like protein/PAS domain S-box-containing protein